MEAEIVLYDLREVRENELSCTSRIILVLQLTRKCQQLVVEALGEAVMAFFVRVEPVGAAWDVDFLLLVGREETAKGIGVDDWYRPDRRGFLD